MVVFSKFILFSVMKEKLYCIVAVVPQYITYYPHSNQRPGVDQRQINSQRGILLPQTLAGLVFKTFLAHKVTDGKVCRTNQQCDQSDLTHDQQRYIRVFLKELRRLCGNDKERDRPERKGCGTHLFGWNLRF